MIATLAITIPSRLALGEPKGNMRNFITNSFSTNSVTVSGPWREGAAQAGCTPRRPD